MTTILDQTKIEERDLRNLIELGAEESINLEFKSGESLGLTNSQKAEIAKDISAFANSAGGIIIYGIKEVNHKADSFSPIRGSELSKEWLEQVIQSRIQRKIEDLLIIPIRLGNNIEETVYVVKIPESSLAPHMTSDKKFYKRYNFESVQMEEYEIRNLFSRKDKTKLIINNIIRAGNPYDENGVMFYDLSFQIENIGKTIEKDYKLIVHFNFEGYTLKWDTLRNEKNFNHSLIEGSHRIMSFSSVCPIFPDEVLTIGHVSFGISVLRLEELIENEKFLLKLLYTNGTDEIEVPLNKIITTYA